MSEPPFYNTELPESASVCRGCGAERVKGYVSQNTIKALAIVGTIPAIPTAFSVAFITHSTPLMVTVLLAMIPGSFLFLKLNNKDKFRTTPDAENYP